MLSIDNGTINLNPTGTSTTTLQSSATNNRTITLPDITDTLVSRNNNDTLTNKILTDNSNNLICRGLWTGSGSGSVSVYSAIAPTSGQVLTATGATTATWQTPSSNGITSLNSLTTGTQTFTTGTSGTNFNISSSEGIHTFNIPNASATNRGLVTTGEQTFAGTKVFSSAPVISSILNTGTLTLPTSTDTLVGRTTTDTLSNKSLNNASVYCVDNTDNTKKIGFDSSGASIGTTLTLNGIQTANRTITFPDITDTLVTLGATQTLTNKTLTAPIISSINNTGTLTLPTSTDTLIGRSTSDFLTNKSSMSGSTAYSTGLASQSTTTVTGSGTTWTAAMVGGLIVFANGAQAFITAFVNSTSLTVAQSQSVTSQSYTLYYGGVQIDNVGNMTSSKAFYTQTSNTIFFDGTTPSKRLLFQTSGSSASTTLTLASTQSTTQTLTIPNITGADTLATLSLVQTMNNKTLTDSATWFQNQTDNTKKMQFDLSSLSTGTTRTFIVPNTSDTLVTLAATQTLTNKTLTAPIISSISNTGTLTLPTSTDTLIGRATTDTLTNKSLSNASCFYVDGTTPTKKIGFQTSGATASTTLTLAGIQTVNRTITFPDATDTVVTLATIQTLTNKTLTNPIISSISNTGTLTLPSSTDTLVGRATTDTLTNKNISGPTNTVSASQLRTATTDVIISGATAPSTGQALIASSSTTATWQNLSGLTWRNTWDSGTSYVINDIITNGGACWICVSNNTNQIPPNAKYWNQVADGFHWKGDWNSGSSYIIDDVIYLNGTSYVCILGHTNQTPPNATYWNVMATSSPAGLTTQVQYNNAGTFAGSSNLTIDTTDSYPIIGEKSGDAPNVPSSGAKLFTKNKAGRRTMGQIGPSGVDYSFQPCLWANKISWWTAQGNGTIVSVINFGNSTTGTATARNVATTNLFTSMRRIGYVSSNPAGSSAGTRHAAQQFWRGNANGLGGFFYVARFGLSSASSVSTQRSFVGLIASTAVLGNANPSSNTSIAMLGFGVDSADTTWYFMHGDGTTVTKDSLTGTFPPRDLSVSMFEARIFCAPNGSTIYYSLEVLGGGSLYEGSTTTTIPSSTTLLSPQIWTNNGSSTGIVGIDIVSQYIETDN